MKIHWIEMLTSSQVICKKKNWIEMLTSSQVICKKKKVAFESIKISSCPAGFSLIDSSDSFLDDT